jgi:hypothetical protein
MKTDTIRAASLAEVQRMVADWKTSRPWARIVREDAPHSHGTNIERGGWTVQITYDEPASN